jgi:hypothetical protein
MVLQRRERAESNKVRLVKGLLGVNRSVLERKMGKEVLGSNVLETVYLKAGGREGSLQMERRLSLDVYTALITIGRVSSRHGRASGPRYSLPKSMAYTEVHAALSVNQAFY